ncbi:MAG TPA: sulfotransferase, partial [Rhizomicrobium sp.]|nr:sulfotransferase [Rhizomicrobium sp.]
AYLNTHPADPDALYLLAEAEMRQGQSGAAERMLAECVRAAPDFAAARMSYAQVLLATERYAAALEQADILLKQLPRNPLVRQLKARAFDEAEEYESSAAYWQELCEDYPDWPEGWLRCGHVLKVLGKQQEAIAAYRKALEIDPMAAGAYWGLAATKAFRFAEDDMERMESLLRRSDLVPGDRVKLHFVLGQAYGDSEAYQKSFANYAKGNALHFLGAKHDPERMTRYVTRNKATLTNEFFRERAGYGCQSAEPIFIVGMPRSGSTLVEQILASHSQIEGTKELPELLATVSEYLDATSPQEKAAFDPALLVQFDAGTCRQLGARYLERAGMHRRTGRPLFTDKMPANFAYIGLIQLILPNAKIIDIRRHPMACGFAIFTELFSGAHDVAYRLADIGFAYRNYVDLMAHFDLVMPGRVHRVSYERLVSETETEIRHLFQYLNLPFEPACLEFHKTARVVTTRSSEQVRRPIYKAAVDRWRNYEQWLGPLKSALGEVVEHEPAA